MEEFKYKISSKELFKLTGDMNDIVLENKKKSKKNHMFM